MPAVQHPSATSTTGGGGRRSRLALLALLLVVGVLGAACGVVSTEVQGEPSGTRYGTAAALAEEAFPDGAEVALLTTAVAFADALAAAPFAAAQDAPILLTAPGEVPQETLDALGDLDVSEIVALGGEAAIGAEVVSTLEEEGYEVRRRAGADRYETAAMLATSAFPDGADVALLATGSSFADALAAAPLATSRDAPILLTGATEVPEATSGALDELGVTEVVLLGGEAVIGPEVEAALSGDRRVSRQAGPDRYATAAMVARSAFPDGADVALLATGSGFADALAAAPLAAAREAPILLTEDARVPEATTSTLQALGVEEVVLLGGEAAIGVAVRDALAIAEYEVTRHAG